MGEWLPFKYDFLTQSQLSDLGLETMCIEKLAPELSVYDSIPAQVVSF